MNGNKKFKTLHGKIAKKLLESIYIIKFLEKYYQGDGEICTLLNILHRNISNSFYKNEKCRKLNLLTK